ncbi:LPS assembly lipoprotein LptE [candidate division WOR-3 bacterium]|nr:LPS assembly lipoprotein LptE [candidate division WOR-3 bacterium]
MRRVLLILLIIFSGCVYSFRGFSALEYKSIRIEPFSNNTLRYGLEDIFYQNTVNEFIRDGRLKVIESGAETILSVVIADYKNEPFTYDEYENIKEYRIDVKLIMEYKKSTGEAIWERNLLEWVTYDSNLTEDDGVNALAEKIALSIVRTVLE